MKLNVQKIGNIFLLIAICISIVWLKYDYQTKINDLQNYIDEQIIAVHYSQTQAEHDITISMRKIEDQISQLSENISAVKKAIEKNIKK